MTLHAIFVPKWGLAMEEGTLASWSIAEGEVIAVGQEIADIETSKIANVLESQVAGILRRHVAAEGDVKAVGALIAVVSDADEDDAAIDAFIIDIESRFETEVKTGDTSPKPETVIVDGRITRYLKVPGGDGTPVVLVHGFGGDYLNWMFNQAALADGRDVYALDLPGHGGTSKDVGAATLDFLGQTVVAWMDAVGLEKVHLVGHSMGAGVTLALALSQPDRVQSLAALAGVGFGGALNSDYVEGFVAAQKRKDMKPVAALLFANADLVTRDLLDDLIAYKRIDGVNEALRLLIDNGLAQGPIDALNAKLADLKMPLLAIYGAEDHVVRTPDASAQPTGSVVIDAAGHMPHLEAVEKVNGLILTFISVNS